MTYMYALTTRFKEDGTFGITELMMDPATLAKNWALSKMPVGRHKCWHGVSLDRLERDSISDTSDGYPDLADTYGVKLHTLCKKMPFEVEALDLYRYYEYMTVEELPVVPPPTLITPAEERAIASRRDRGGMKALLPALA